MLAGEEASIDDATLIQRSSRARCVGGGRRRELPDGGGAVRGGGVLGGEVGAALPDNRVGQPAKMGGYRKPVLDPHRAFIVERIERVPHLTLHRLKDELAARGVKVSHHAVWVFLRREGLRFKKTLFALEQSRADIVRRRRRWRSLQPELDPSRLVFIDETWIKTTMAPLRGWGRKGERLRGFAPHGHWRTRPSSAPCARTGSPPRASSTGRSTGSASAPMSNSFSCPCSNPATSSSWTISARTSPPRSAR